MIAALVLLGAVAAAGPARAQISLQPRVEQPPQSQPLPQPEAVPPSSAPRQLTPPPAAPDPAPQVLTPVPPAPAAPDAPEQPGSGQVAPAPAPGAVPPALPDAPAPTTPAEVPAETPAAPPVQPPAAPDGTPAGEGPSDAGALTPGSLGLNRLPPAPAAPQRSFEDMPVALLRGLDKITGRASSFEAKVGEVARFGQLLVHVRACRKAPPIEPPESAAFLEITELRPDEGAVALFSGWMFASSPALSALEHPVYDVWVIDCRKAETSTPSSSSD
ncbi:DUF2155 domain-containing protein [Rhodospirillum centenum]|uniref:DUF2155 domain-containing protein n=1 Tax=Rhodospirillum centenum TaxID=34018 RepID=UPI000A01A2D6|nr:DUF2155 domain-containing protein [Rhodospirillum centenum]